MFSLKLAIFANYPFKWGSGNIIEEEVARVEGPKDGGEELCSMLSSGFDMAAAPMHTPYLWLSAPDEACQHVSPHLTPQ